MLQIKIFVKEQAPDLEAQINDWLELNPTVEITTILQSECTAVTTISIFYKK